MRVRPGTLPDLADLVALDRSCFTPPWSPGQIRNELLRPESRVVVADAGTGPPRGYACGRLLGGAIELLRVATAPTHRRQGVARLLITELAATAAAHGARRLLLEVEATNAPAIGLYRSLGVGLDARRAGYYGPGRDAVLMSTALPLAARRTRVAQE